ncbi:MAG: DUF4588 domain-containing protein [Minisyncoccota bacterium]
MRKVILLALLFVGACELQKVEPDSSTARSRAANKELQDFRDEVCPAAINGLRAVTEKRVMNPENFRDTTVLMDLRETAAMLKMVLDECFKDAVATQDTTSTPDSTSEKPEVVRDVRIASLSLTTR